MRQAQMTRNERRYYRKKIIEQRLMGLGVLLAPLGLWLLFSKQILIY